MDNNLVLKTYVDGVSDTPFPSVGSQIQIADFTYDAKRMGGAPTITATVMFETCLDDVWAENVYAEFEGEKYFLKQTPTSSYSNEDARYKHEVELISERFILENVYFYDVVASDTTNDKPVSNSSNVVFYGNIEEFAKRLNYSLQYAKLQTIDEEGNYISGYRVIVDEGIETEGVLMSFDNQFIANVLQEIYNQYQVPYYFVGKDIHIGFSPTEIETPFEYGAENALLAITKTNANYKVVNRATGIGSADNIPYYYPNTTPYGDVSMYLKRVNPSETTITEGITISNLSDFAKVGLNDVFIFDKSVYNAAIDKTLQSAYAFTQNTMRFASGVEFRYAFELKSSEATTNTEITMNLHGFYGNFGNMRIRDEVTGYTVAQWSCDSSKTYHYLSVTTNKLGKGRYTAWFTLYSDTKVFPGVGSVEEAMTFVQDNVTLTIVQKGVTETHWALDGGEVDIAEYGIAIDSSIELQQGDEIHLKQDSYIIPQTNLMPPIYRDTLGAERFYNALNDTYINPDGKDGECYEFENPYVDGKPKEQIVSFEDIKPTIKEITNADGNLFGMFTEFAFDDDDNDETEEIDGTTHYKHPFFFGKLRKFDGEHGFNLFDHAIDEDEMVVSFTSGSCGACEFTIVVTDDTQENTVQVYEADITDADGTFHAKGSLKRDANGNVLCGREHYQSAQIPQAIQNDTINNEVWVALRKDDQTFGVLMPNAQFDYKPKSATTNADGTYNDDGDEFVLLHINLPQAYITAAEERLKEEIIKYISENNSEKFTFSITFSRIFLAENPDIYALLNENTYLKVKYNNVEYPLYVSSYSYKVTSSEALPEITVELKDVLAITNNALQTAISQVESKVFNAIDILASGSSSGNVAQEYIDKFIRKDIADTVSNIITFKKGIRFNETNTIDGDGNANLNSLTIGGNSFFTEDGKSILPQIDTAKILADSNSETATIISSNNFDGTSALVGTGYGIVKDGTDYRMAIDYMTVRKGMTVAELIIQEYKSVGGVLVVSACNGEVTNVILDSEDEEGNSMNILTFKDWDKHPQFQVGDIARCSRWDTESNSYIYYRGIVEIIDSNNVYLRIVDGEGVPQVGDNLVQFGNIADTARQGLIIISTENGMPNITAYDGLNSANVVMLDKMCARLGYLNGLVKDGETLSGYGLWTNNLYLSNNGISQTFAEYAQTISNQFDVTEKKFNSVYKATNSALGNMLLQTNQGVTGWQFTNGNVGNVEISERTENDIKGVLFMYNETVTPSWEVITYQLRPEKIVEGGTYTLSFDVMELNSTGGVTMKLDICDATAKNSLLSSRVAFPQATKAEEWVTFSVSFTASASGTATGAQRIYLAIDSAYNGKWNGLTFRNLKLEAGSVSTPWSKAPEDVVAEEINSEVAIVTNQISEISQTVDVISTRVTNNETTLTSYGTRITNNETKITQNANSITAEVTARTEGDTELSSQITQTADSIDLKLREKDLSNINHAYGTETPFVMTSGFANIANQTVKLFDVTGLATGDKVSLSYTVRIKGIVWGENAFINTQFSTMYGWVGGNLRITEQYLIDNGIEADEEGFYTIHCQATGITIGKNYTGGSDAVVDAVPSDVGYVYMRLDYISADETTGAVIEVSKLKVEIGTEVTEWTARTGDLEEALLDTGINISEKKITVTANQFEVRNNNGDVTASVDNAGRLTSNTFIAKEGTSKRTTINEDFNGFGRWYYPDSDIPCIEIGWDESQSSFIRVYDKDGNMAWKLDTSLAFNNPTNNVWYETELYNLGLDYDSALTLIKTPGALTMQTYYTINRAGVTRVYTEQRDDYDYATYGVTGYFTGMSDAKLADVPESNKYYRTLKYYEEGKLVSSTEIIFNM